LHIFYVAEHSHFASVSSHCFIFLGIKTVGKNSFKLNRNGMILTMNIQSSSTREGETKENGKSLKTIDEVLIKNLAIFFLFHSKELLRISFKIQLLEISP
jgi:hypothetical protein